MDDKWYVRNTEGKVFGPINLETLKSWVKDGRVEPLAGVSNDLQNWVLAPLKPELEMNWVVENNPGQFYGPTHRAVIEDLIKTGSLSRDVRFYEDDGGAAAERIAMLESALSAKDAEVSRREVAIAEAQRQRAKIELSLAGVQKAVAQRDDRVNELVATVAQKDGQIETLTKSLKMREGELIRAGEDLARKNAEIAQAQQEVARRDAEIADLKRQMAARDEVHERAWTTEVVEPEVVVDAMPPPVARQAFGFGVQTSPTRPAALADLERRAQEELARMGAGNAKKFFKFKR